MEGGQGHTSRAQGNPLYKKMARAKDLNQNLGPGKLEWNGYDIKKHKTQKSSKGEKEQCND